MQFEDFATIEKIGSTAVIWMDHRKESMNIVSPAVIEVFEAVFNQIENDPDIAAAVFISRKPDFIAGADIKSFAVEKPGDFLPYQKKGLELLERIEKSRKPVVSAIHGAAVGLGTELSLACAAILVSDAPKTFMGLPEVKIGLMPGGGGTQRLPRRVGLRKALDMILTGKNIYAYQAKRMGLADEVVAPDKLLSAALQLAERLQKAPLQRKRKKSLADRFLDDTSLGRSIVFRQAKKIALRQTQGNYPAVEAIFDCVQTGLDKGLAAGYAKELEWFEKLMLTPESAALRSIFFGMTANKKNPFGKPERPVDTVGIVGAGFMGAGIAEVTVSKDIPVLLKDIQPEVLAAAQKQLWKSLEKKVRNRSLRKTQAEALLGKLSGQLQYDHFEHADLVIEAVLEKMDLKKRIIDDIQQHGRPDAIIATNTSALSVTEMAEYAKNPERVVGMHYFSPVPKMPLLEIVRTKYSTDEVLAACYDLGIRQGKTCIVVQDGPGFYVNRILAPYLNECLLMVDEGVSIEVVDKALRKAGFPVGPITLLDQVGLDIASHVSETTRPLVEGREGFTVSDSVVRMAEAGRLGRKSGRGFYRYDPKTNRKKGVDPGAYDFFKGKGNLSLPLEDIQNRALMLMLNEAVMCLKEGIIANENDGNLAAVFGIGFPPFTGGPFRYIETLGAEKVIAIMEDLAARYGARFTPHPGLRGLEG